MKQVQVVTFQIAQYTFGLLSDQVMEVLEPSLITPVARAPKHLAGIITIRGMIVTVIDLAHILQVERHKFEPRYHLITKIDDEWVSILADSIGDIVEAQLPEAGKCPFTIDQTWSHLVTNMVPHNDQMIYILDIRDYLIAPERLAA